MVSAPGRRSVRLWLFVTSFLVFSMVAVGGLTRLTRSGLSIVEWKPVSGVLPPLDEAEWKQEFDKYKQFPEYQKVNAGMDLEDFKFIFYWEYFHRLLGRVIGLVFALPLVFFILRKMVNRRLGRLLLIALVLGGMQGALGWFMVKSGLVDRPSVSHYRLAAHLGLALFLMSYLFWLAQGLRVEARRTVSSFGLARVAKGFLALVSVQIFYGALTAGLHAGHMYNTFPTMNGLWVPQGIGSLGLIRDFFENPVTVQFVHRCLGWAVLSVGLVLAWKGVKGAQLLIRQRRALLMVGGAVSLQFVLGVLTLLNAVPVALGSLHQMGACVLLLTAVNAVHCLRKSSGLVAYA